MDITRRTGQQGKNAAPVDRGGHGMLIGVVGGLDRDAHRLITLAREAGHDAEIHTGHVGGSTGVQSLRGLVSRANIILVLTDVNSHGAVHLTRRLARAHNKPIHLMRRFGTTQFAAFLRDPRLATPTAVLPSSDPHLWRAA